MRVAFALGFRATFRRAGAVVLLASIVCAGLTSASVTVAMALPHALNVGHDRENARLLADRSSTSIRPVRGRPLIAAERYTTWHSTHIGVVEIVWRAGGTPPPGISALPKPGHSVVSPALAAAMTRVATRRALEIRIPSPDALIGDGGLASPDEYFAYVGVAAPPPRRTESEREFAPVTGWGIPGVVRAEVPSRIVLVLLALIILPLAALVAFLLRLDSRRRAARTATMHVLGCNRLHSVAMDAGALLPSIAVGWLFAFAGQTGTNHFVAAQVFANHVAFAEDLRAGQRIWWAVLVLLVLALSGSSFVDQDPEVIVARVAGAGGYRLRLRLVIGAVLLTAGVVLVLAIVNSAASSTMQSVGPMLAAVALVLSGQTVALPCIVIGLGRVLAMRHIAGDLARGRLALSRAAWRSPALSLTLLGVIAAIALAALTALDAAADSGATYWDRDRFPADLAIVSATPHGFTSVLPRYTDHIYPLLPAQRAQFLSTQPDHAPTNALFVPCAVLTDIVRVPSETFRPCRQAWVINRSLIRPGHRIVRARPGAVALEVRWGAAVAPTELVDGTESVLIPTRARRLTALLARTRAPQIQGLVRVRSEQQVEMIRDALWNEPGIPLEGISSSPGPIATKHDFIVDGGRYQRAYTPVVTGSLVLASATAVLVVALGAALEVAEASKRNAILVALGTPTSVLRGVLALTTLTPYVLATLLGLLTGAALGGAYLDIGGYRSLDGPLHGFPFGPFAAFGGVELAIVAALAVLGFLVAGRTVRQVDAGSLTSDVA